MLIEEQLAAAAMAFSKIDLKQEWWEEWEEGSDRVKIETRLGVPIR